VAREIQEIRAIGPSEKSITVAEAVKLGLFNKLNKINILLTNKCNLRCNYCYEQHKKDFGTVTVEKVKKVFDFLRSIGNTDVPKDIQFFGGEPMLRKDVILDFLKEHEDELREHSSEIKVNMVTNGTLLTQEFVDEYESYGFTLVCFSLDTLDEDMDERGVDTEELYDTIANMFSKEFKLQGRLGIRCTMNPKNVLDLDDFVDRLYAVDVRNMIVHPLTYSATDGLVEWSKEAWESVYGALRKIYKKYPDFDIEFAEGVGHKGGSNCMIASDMMALDGSGEYTGCYFFTNNKVEAANTVLGNIFDDKIYIDNYKYWFKTYEESFNNPVCQSCNIQGLCYSCPAGNLTVFGEPYSNYKACSQITQFHVDLRAFQNEAVFEALVERVAGELNGDTISARLLQLAHKWTTNHVWKLEEIRKGDVPSFNEGLLVLEEAVTGKRTKSPESILHIYNELRRHKDGRWLPPELSEVTPGFKAQVVYVVSALDMIIFNKVSSVNENNTDIDYSDYVH
jgi:uncharacterized protein